jgi:hypothetical protein
MKTIRRSLKRVDLFLATLWEYVERKGANFRWSSNFLIGRLWFWPDWARAQRRKKRKNDRERRQIHGQDAPSCGSLSALYQAPLKEPIKSSKKRTYLHMFALLKPALNA